MHGKDDAAVIAIFFVFGMPTIAFIIVRVLAHRERMEMIRRGIAPPDRGFGRSYRQANVGAPQWTGPPPGVTPDMTYDVDSAQRSLRKGITLALVGLAILIGLSFIGYEPNGGAFATPTIQPGPWLLGGLIPMFVGIAQIIVAVLSGARLSVQPQTPFVPPPPPAGSELARPAPPDRG